MHFYDIIKFYCATGGNHRQPSLVGKLLRYRMGSASVSRASMWADFLFENSSESWRKSPRPAGEADDGLR